MGGVGTPLAPEVLPRVPPACPRQAGPPPRPSARRSCGRPTPPTGPVQIEVLLRQQTLPPHLVHHRPEELASWGWWTPRRKDGTPERATHRRWSGRVGAWELRPLNFADITEGRRTERDSSSVLGQADGSLAREQLRQFLHVAVESTSKVIASRIESVTDVRPGSTSSTTLLLTYRAGAGLWQPRKRWHGRREGGPEISGVLVGHDDA